jgi:cell division protease FtsH
MVTTYGMSKVLGPLAYQQGQQNMFLTDQSPNPRRMVSDETAPAIDQEVKDIVETGHEQAIAILNHNRDLLETIAQKLIEVEVIEGDELHQLLQQMVAPPVFKNLPEVVTV